MAALLLGIAACTPPSLPFARLAGLVTSRQLGEISGLAASHAHDGVLWAINDGGNPARLYAISRRGRLLARYEVEGADNQDWEDLASFELDGRRYLLLADTGDNGGRRRGFSLHVFEEPAELANGRLKPAWTIRARWPDGPRDCEAVAVDAAAGKVLLISKKRVPPELLSLPQAGNTVVKRRNDTSRYTGTWPGNANGQTPPGKEPVSGSTSSKASIFALT